MRGRVSGRPAFSTGHEYLSIVVGRQYLANGSLSDHPEEKFPDVQQDATQRYVSAGTPSWPE